MHTDPGAASSTPQSAQVPPAGTNALLTSAVRHGGGWTVAFAVAALAGAAAELALPAALGRAVDAALGQSDSSPWLVVAALAVAVVVIAEVIEDLSAGTGSARATARLRHRLVRHVLALDLRNADRHRSGDLVTRVVSQAADAGQAGVPVVRLITTAVPAVGGLVALALLDLWLGITFLVGLLLLSGLLRRYVSDAADAAGRYQTSQGDIAARLVEVLAGARTIGAAGTASREASRVLAPLPELGAQGQSTWRTLGQAASRGAVAGPLLQVGVIAVGGLALADGRLTPGQLFAALQYAALGAGLGAVVTVLSQFVRAKAGCARIAGVLADPCRAYGGADLPAGPGRLELRGVTVRVGGHRALDGVDLIAPGGALVAVVGRSGAGKSLLAAVAGRLIDPDEGEVTLDGVPLATLDRATLRRAVGVAFERPVLVGETVADAISLAQPPGGLASRPSVEDAARAARIDTVIERLPDGYRSPLAATPLSGGEVQRLGLARALGADRLLVLDDATSSLDTVTEHELNQALAGAADLCTRLLVAHRASAAARADLVVWLDEGRVRATGSHRVLWRDPAYRQLFQGGADALPTDAARLPGAAGSPGAGGPSNAGRPVDPAVNDRPPGPEESP